MSENELRSVGRESGPGAETSRDDDDPIRRDLDTAFARLEHMRRQTDLLTDGLLEAEQAKATSDRLLAEAQEENARLTELLQREREERDRLQQLLDQCQGTLSDVLGGASWRLTAPLRALRRRRN